MKTYSFGRAVFLCARQVKRVLWLVLEECGGCLKDVRGRVQGRVHDNCRVLITHLLWRNRWRRAHTWLLTVAGLYLVTARPEKGGVGSAVF